MIYSIYLFYCILVLVHAEVSVKMGKNVVLGDIEMLTKEKSMSLCNFNLSTQQEKGEHSKSSCRSSAVSVHCLTQ